MTTSQQLDDAVTHRTIEMLQQQRDALQAEVDKLRALVGEIPGLILSARLDAKEGKQTILARRFYLETAIMEPTMPAQQNEETQRGASPIA